MQPVMHGLHFRDDVLLSAHTTLGLGGAARFFADACTVDDLCAAITVSREERLPFFVLGGGSNVVISDDGFPGVVLHIASRGIDFSPYGYRCLVRVAAGEQWDDVVHACVKRGLGGIECLSGIPGTAGATPVQNVGAYGQEVAETIARVHALDIAKLETRIFEGGECGFDYRWSRFKGTDAGRFIITSVEFDLPVTSHSVIRYPDLARAIQRDVHQGPDGHPTAPLAQAREAVLRLRASKGMVLDPADPESRSAGSFFTNPILDSTAFAALQDRWRQAGNPTPVPSYSTDRGVKIPAAWLVENAGFRRGTRRGGVGVSAKHALALVNYGGSARELLAFADEIQQGVVSVFGVRLEMEPVIFAGTKRE
jgi:UDP-N-acetylmuramate dehydrogenase